MFTRSSIIDSNAPDLGFELLVAVRPVTPLSRLFRSTVLITWLGFLVIICVGQARNRGQLDADASTETWSEPLSVTTACTLSYILHVVSERSIMNRKRQALRRSITLGNDSEAQSAPRPGRLAVLARKLKAPFTRQFWEDRFEPSEDETLVDSRVLSYAYLEVGVIETIGSWVSCLLYSSAQLRHSLQFAGILYRISQEGVLTERPSKGSEEWRRVACTIWVMFVR
jgi:hypothetical protein